MVLLDKLWDDVFGGPSPERGLGKLRKAVSTKPLAVNGPEGEGESSGGVGGKYLQRAASAPTTPRKENIWRSVFHPGSNLATRRLGAGDLFDRPTNPNSPTIYDWLYSDDTRSNHR